MRREFNQRQAQIADVAAMKATILPDGGVQLVVPLVVTVSFRKRPKTGGCRRIPRREREHRGHGRAMARQRAMLRAPAMTKSSLIPTMPTSGFPCQNRATPACLLGRKTAAGLELPELFYSYACEEATRAVHRFERDGGGKAKEARGWPRLQPQSLSGLGTSDQEQWFPDPRLDNAYQLSDYFYTRDDGAFDKGHIVRRDDAAWGKTYTLLRRANGDTYHVTELFAAGGWLQPQQPRRRQLGRPGKSQY